ncbi:MAG: L-threonylcarbamoyladenylate synthase [Pseudohongiellaceae bacterium]
MQKETLTAACKHLQSGKIIAYPTEAVWGLGCDPFNASAVRRILRLKQRPESKGLILVAAAMEQIQVLLAPLEDEALEALTETWPGPITWLIPDPRNIFPSWVKGEHGSVAIRVSDHPVVQALCQRFGRPIVSTSANRAGMPEIKTRAKLEAAFSGKSSKSGSKKSSKGSKRKVSDIDFIVPGRLGGQEQPSEIRDLISGKVLR